MLDLAVLNRTVPLGKCSCACECYCKHKYSKVNERIDTSSDPMPQYIGSCWLTLDSTCNSGGSSSSSSSSSRSSSDSKQ